MVPHRPWLAFVLLSVTVGAAIARAQTPPCKAKPARRVTSSDVGPDVDARKLAASRYTGLRALGTFRSFVSSAYALADVWVYAADDDAKLYATPLVYPYPRSYTPTWGEVFDHVARQMRCTWAFDPTNRQFRFARSAAGPPFGVTLAEGWRREDRGLYVWHAPPGERMGMDVYDLGQYSAATDDDRAKTFAAARARAAMFIVGQFPEPPTVERMARVQVAGVEALYLKMDTPRPGGVWRQWAFVKDGRAFLIVSATEKAKAAEINPAVDAMVKSFTTKAATETEKGDAPAPSPVLGRGPG